jgi:L-alanine-DL-glutamate epimerase-like enolase superfamily enzyme
MKITDIHVLSTRLPASAAAMVQIDTDEGIVGVGATSAPALAIAALVQSGPESIRAILEGADPTNTNDAWRSMFASGQRGRSGEGGLAVNAMAAVDMALWDIAGKARGLPVHELLGGAVQEQVMAYASGTAFDIERVERTGELRMKSTDALVVESKENVARGFKAIKFGWGNNFGPQDMEVLRAIRDAIGPEIRLMLDFGCPAYLGGEWNVKDAIRVARLLEELDIFFLEEPLYPYDVDGFATLTAESPIKIATGESLTTVREFQPFITRHAVDIIQPDAQQIGITQLVRVAQRAEEASIPCVPHGPWSAMTVAAHIAVLSTMSNGIMIEYPSYAVREGSAEQELGEAMLDRVIEQPVVLKDGYLQLPETAGLGLGDYDLEAIAELEEHYAE